jgi:hypothetical protein
VLGGETRPKVLFYRGQIRGEGSTRGAAALSSRRHGHDGRTVIRWIG